MLSIDVCGGYEVGAGRAWLRCHSVAILNRALRLDWQAWLNAAIRQSTTTWHWLIGGGARSEGSRRRSTGLWIFCARKAC